jgi:hypothetical protein
MEDRPREDTIKSENSIIRFTLGEEKDDLFKEIINLGCLTKSFPFPFPFPFH